MLKLCVFPLNEKFLMLRLQRLSLAMETRENQKNFVCLIFNRICENAKLLCHLDFSFLFSPESIQDSLFLLTD